MESKIANLVQYNYPYPQLGQTTAGLYDQRNVTIEEIAKLKVEREQHERDMRNQAAAACVVELAERLVLGGTETPLALKAAEEFVRDSLQFAKEFKL